MDTHPTDTTAPAAEEKVAKARGNQTAELLRMMRRKQGATIAAMQETTGWKPHSVRAALSTMRRKGIDIAREKNRKGETCYRITEQ